MVTLICVDSFIQINFILFVYDIGIAGFAPQEKLLLLVIYCIVSFMSVLLYSECVLLLLNISAYKSIQMAHRTRTKSVFTVENECMPFFLFFFHLSFLSPFTSTFDFSVLCGQ